MCDTANEFRCSWRIQRYIRRKWRSEKNILTLWKKWRNWRAWRWFLYPWLLECLEQFRRILQKKKKKKKKWKNRKCEKESNLMIKISKNIEESVGILNRFSVTWSLNKNIRFRCEDLVKKNVSKVGDLYRGVPKAPFSTVSATPFAGLRHFTLDPYLIMLSVK